MLSAMGPAFIASNFIYLSKIDSGKYNSHQERFCLPQDHTSAEQGEDECFLFRF